MSTSAPMPGPIEPAVFGLTPARPPQPLGGGRNSRVYLIEQAGEAPVVLKQYFRSPNDPRDRQGAEAGALRFLAQCGEIQVPRLLQEHRDSGQSLLEFVPGKAAPVITNEHMKQAGAFLSRLVGYGRLEEARHFGPASEAFFSVRAIRTNLEARLQRLDDVDSTIPHHAKLRSLLTSMRQVLDVYWSDLRLDPDAMLHQAERILSPSDFGTHNAILRPDAVMCFLDFEYFGWDAPAKTLADFLLHPAMQLDAARYAAFARAALPSLPPGALYDAQTLLPLFVVKWCCILLNEFVFCDRSRRLFSGCEMRESALQHQLAKARAMLSSLPRAQRIIQGLL